MSFPTECTHAGRDDEECPCVEDRTVEEVPTEELVQELKRHRVAIARKLYRPHSDVVEMGDIEEELEARGVKA
jgi:hypothetical protein